MFKVEILAIFGDFRLFYGISVNILAEIGLYLNKGCSNHSKNSIYYIYFHLRNILRSNIAILGAKFYPLVWFSHFSAIFIKISAKSAKYLKTRYSNALKNCTSPIYFFERNILGPNLKIHKVNRTDFSLILPY